MKRARNINEYVAQYVVVAMNSPKINKLERKIKHLKKVLKRYEAIIDDHAEDYGTCDNCDEYFFSEELVALDCCNTITCNDCCDYVTCFTCDQTYCLEHANPCKMCGKKIK